MNRRVSLVEEWEYISDIIADIRSQLRWLVREEIQLAKTEMSEKLGRLRRNLILVVGGAISLYTAAIFLLGGVAILIALGLQTAGLHPLLAAALGAVAVCIMIGTTGYLLLQKGIASLGESLLPERTLRTLGLTKRPDSEMAATDLRSSVDLQSQVERRQDLLGQDLVELKARLQAQRVLLVQQSRQHPLRFIWLTTAVTVAGFQLAKRFFKNPGRT